MAHLKLQKIEVPPGSEWMANSYPNDGAYLTSLGICIRLGASLMVINYPGWETLVQQGEPGDDPVNVHRLLDQMIELTAAKRAVP